MGIRAILTHFSGLSFERGFRLMMRRRFVKRLGSCPLFAKIALGTSNNVPNDAVVPEPYSEPSIAH